LVLKEVEARGRLKRADEFPLSSSNEPFELSASHQIIIWKKPSPAALSVRDLFIQASGAACGGLQPRLPRRRARHFSYTQSQANPVLIPATIKKIRPPFF
jgi:hypothetical protein